MATAWLVVMRLPIKQILQKEKIKQKRLSSKFWKSPKIMIFFLNSRNIEAGLGFFTSAARLAFTKLRQVFVKAPILHHFDPKYHIQMKIDASKYAISKILSQMTLDSLGQ